jgi:hypothetical protein
VAPARWARRGTTARFCAGDARDGARARSRGALPKQGRREVQNLNIPCRCELTELADVHRLNIDERVAARATPRGAYFTMV